MRPWLFPFLLAGCAGSPALPPPPASPVPDVIYPPAVTEKLDSRYGPLEIVRHEELFTLRRDGKALFEDDILITGNPTVVRRGQLGDEDFLLLSRYSGDGCPETNVLILLGPGGSYHVHHLGNCNGPVISVKGGALGFDYKGSRNTEPERKPQRWVYRSGVLKRLE